MPVRAAIALRWLRPEFQNKGAAAAAAEGEQMDLDVGADDAAAMAPAPATAAARPWPPTLPEQIAAIAQVLASAPAPLHTDAVAAQFKGRGRWRERLPVLLDTLSALGRVQQLPSGLWVGV